MNKKTLILMACVLILPLLAMADGLSGARQPVIMIGDSMMKMPGQQLERMFSQRGIPSSTFSNIGTGLARLEAFDWMAKLDELLAGKPKVAIVAIGANDKQPMQTLSGALKPGTPEWSAEYAKRVGAFMDKLIAGGCEHVIWWRLPPMKNADVDAFVREVNVVVNNEAKSRPQVIPYSFAKLVTARNGKYTEVIMDRETNRSIRVRDIDGIHLTADGSRIVARDLLDQYWP